MSNTSGKPQNVISRRRVLDLWEHFAFGRDKAYLRKTAYPVLKDVCQFWDDHLKRRPDGTLVTPDGWSPEHGPDEEGVTSASRR
ncbi:MAG: glycosyl hydrolase family 95 catalytic domain-containing protein [Pirellulaceae bacterium]